MSEIEELCKIVGHLAERQKVLANILIHIGSRADIYDNTIGEYFNELYKLDKNFNEAK